MAISTGVRAPVRAALHALIDYAGLFPPAKLPFAAALREYDGARRGPHAWMLGRFVVAAPLLAQSPLAGAGPFSVIADPDATALAGVAELRRRSVAVAAVEIPLVKSVSPLGQRLLPDEVVHALRTLAADLAAATLEDVPAFVEIPTAQPWRDLLGATMEALRRYELGAKLRSGGITADAFPSVEDVAAFLAAAGYAGVPFKATAGLHHPVRRRDPETGVTMHGFLNIIAAAALARDAQPQRLCDILAEEDAGAFRFDGDALWWRDLRVDVDALRRTRSEAFVAYGSCSFAEPVDDLIALRMLPAR